METAIASKETSRFVPPENWQGELKALLTLGLPMAFTQLAHFAVYTIDVVMIGRLSPVHLAAASLGTVVYFLLWMIGFGPVMAVIPLVAQALGADQADRKDARRSVRMALWAICFMFPVIFILTFGTETALIAMGQDPEISAMAADYMLALAFGWPFALGVMVLRNFLAAIEKTTVPLVLVIMTTLFNAGLNYVLIYGHFGFPRLELVGAGIASSIAYAVSFGMFVIYLHTDKIAKTFNIFKNFWKTDWPRFREVIRLGLPITVTTLFEGVMFNAAALLMGVIGIAELAAWQVGINVVALAFMFPWGLAMAGSTRVGLAAGAGRPDAVKRVAVLTITISVVAIGFAAIIVGLAPNFIAGLYLNIQDPANTPTLFWVGIFLPIAACFMLFDASQVAANQILRGLKDVRWPMVLTGISYWAIGFPLMVWLTFYTQMGAPGIWWGLMAGLIVASLTLGARLWWVAWREEPKV